MPAQPRAASIDLRSSVLHCASFELEARAREDFALELESGNRGRRTGSAWHRRRSQAATRAAATATANGTRRCAVERQAGRTDATRAGTRDRASAARAPRIRASTAPRPLTRMTDAHAVANDDRRQPAEAGVARRARSAVGAVEARRRRRSTKASATPCGSSLRDQEQAGIDIVTDGEQTRRHFVTTFIEGLDGVDFEHKKTVRIRNRYDADVPVVVGPVARRHPIYVDDARVPARADDAAGQVHAARPDDDGRHALRRALRQPREARAGRSPRS